MTSVLGEEVDLQVLGEGSPVGSIPTTLSPKLQEGNEHRVAKGMLAWWLVVREWWWNVGAWYPHAVQISANFSTELGTCRVI